MPVLGAGCAPGEDGAGRRCCGPGCLCCELAERAFKTGGGTELAKRTGAGVSCLCALWRCRKLAVQAAYILVPASRMSTGRGILPS